MEKKFTLITGASMGIGRALAEECAQRGRNILMVALEGPELQTAATEIAQKYQVEVHPLGIDLTAPDAPLQVYNWSQENGYSVDMLINNAGFGKGDIMERVPLVVYQTMLRLNNQVPFELTYHFLPHLKQQKQAYILNTSSMEGLMPMPFKAAYTSTKHFVTAFSLSLREELADTSISVSTLCPGPVVTNEDGLKRIQRSGPKAKLVVMFPHQVAPIAINGLLRGKRIIIPGVVNQIMILLNNVLPLALRMRMLRKIGSAIIPKKEV
ncbi:SDR family NAD(P)-dependent oxidoreductase [Haliscomenobacter sp.]|uniref:SDR family NAD(P)-dependent oxidoreductase n=1 Tax=Haliscomenobacter sp. TaxID=2717303 RepID=UPI0033652AF1